MVTFSKTLKVKDLIIEYGLTIRALADLSGISKSTIGEIALGTKRKLSKGQIRGLCKAFNCKEDELYEYTDDEY